MGNLAREHAQAKAKYQRGKYAREVKLRRIMAQGHSRTVAESILARHLQLARR